MDRGTGKKDEKRKPSIIITTQVYPPEVQATAVMVRELAGHLATNGWDVTVCAGLPYHPYGRLYDGWKWKLWQKQKEDGYKLLRAGHFIHKSRSIPVRFLIYLTQAFGTAALATLCKKADIVLVYGPPLVGPLCGALVAARHRAKFVNVIYDIYPDLAVETGKVANPIVIGMARVVEKIQYYAADMTIVLSDGFKRQLIERGAAAEKIEVIPVWLDETEIKPMDRDNPWRRENGIPLEKFVVLYAGTIGVISGASMVAEAAYLLRDNPNILFLFVGDGEEKPRLQARAKELGLNNIMFLPYQPRERLSEVQSTADVGIVTMLPGRGRTSVPSKVLGYMAAGRPVIASADLDSDTALEIKNSKIGFVCPPGDMKAFAEIIARLSRQPKTVKRLGLRARKRFEENYTKKAVIAEYEKKLLSLCSKRN